MSRDEILNLWWVRALIAAVSFGVLTGLYAAHRRPGSGVADGLIAGVIGGAVFGLLMSRMTREQQVAREHRTAVFTSGLTAEHRALAVRASRRGPVPTTRRPAQRRLP